MSLGDPDIGPSKATPIPICAACKWIRIAVEAGERGNMPVGAHIPVGAPPTTESQKSNARGSGRSEAWNKFRRNT